MIKLSKVVYTAPKVTRAASSGSSYVEYVFNYSLSKVPTRITCVKTRTGYVNVLPQVAYWWGANTFGWDTLGTMTDTSTTIRVFMADSTYESELEFSFHMD